MKKKIIRCFTCQLILFVFYSLLLSASANLSAQQKTVESKAPVPDSKVISTIKVKDINPVGIVMIDKQLLVLDSANALITKFDPKTENPVGSVQLTVKTGRGLSAEGKTVWVADNSSKTIQCIDLQTGKTIKTFTVPIDGDKVYTTIEAPAFDGKYLWVALSAGWSSKILKMNSQTGKLIMWVFADCLPKGIVSDGKNLFILAYNKGVYKGSVNMMVVNEDATKMNLSKKILCKTPGKEPSGIALDGKDLWISDKQLKSIQKIKLPM